MNKELDEALVRDFPKLLKQRRLTIYQSCLGRGFEIGDGWEPLVRDLFVELNPYAEHNGLEISQVKEKFGLLRIYINFPADVEISQEIRDKVWDLLGKYEVLSAKICEECGTTDNIKKKASKNRYWIQTLCEKCHENN